MINAELKALSLRIGIGLTIFNLEGNFGEELDESFFSHNHPICERTKTKVLQDCWTFDRDRVALEMRRRGMPFWKICHAGLAEYVLPVHYRNQVAAILSVGSFILLNGKAELKAEMIHPCRQDIEILDSRGAEGVASWSTVIVSHLEKWLSQRPLGPSIGRKEKMEEFFQRFHESFDLRLEDLARHLHLSSSRVTGWLKDEFGVGFPELLARTRHRRALQLLQYTSLPIGVVAREVGYGDPNYFMRRFRDFEGMTPKEFRKRTLKENV